MPVSTFVGGGSAAYGPTPWTTLLQVTTSNLPTGIQTNDRVLLLISAYHVQDRSPLDDTLGSFNGLSDFSYLGRANFTATSPGNFQRWQLYAYTALHTASIYPLSIVPIGATSGTTYTPLLSGNFRAQVFAWTPARDAGGTDTSGHPNADTQIPDENNVVAISESEGIAVAAAAMPAGGTIGALDVANGFTERYVQAPIATYGGSLVIADRTPGVTGSVITPRWVKPTGNSGVAMLIAFNGLSVAADEWGVNVIRW